MRIVFFGTPHFAAEVLQFLLEKKADLVGVVTQPDRPKGRSGGDVPSAVKQVALEAGLRVFQPEKASQEDFLVELRAMGADLYVVVAFGQILPQKLLDIPRYGCINVHASLLPKYRGAAPMQRSLMDGVQETGVCVQKMVRQLDAGDVIVEAKVPVSPKMTFGELQKELCDLSKPLLLSVIYAYETGVPEGKAQDVEQVTFAPKIETEEGEIDWSLPAEKIHNKVRALSPRPGAWCWVDLDGEKKRLKILRTKVVEKGGSAGDFLLKEGVVFCGDKGLQFVAIQLEGKRAMPAGDWLRGLKTPPSFKFFS